VFRGALVRLYEASAALNRRNILQLVSDRPYVTFCDLGCDDGLWTVDVATSSRAERMFGVELVAERARLARTNGVNVSVSDLAHAFPFRDASFDLVHSNQVIEHVADIDNFLAETSRVLKVGGAAVISTENGSSWHNIFAAIMGWQIFSLTNVSGLSSGVGNPLALHRGSPLDLASWTHKTIFNYRGLLEILELHGLTVVQALGAGYYPLPAPVGRFDVRHSHFLAVKAVKLESTKPSRSVTLRGRAGTSIG
jgi:SAM-dependent methyltransferase